MKYIKEVLKKLTKYLKSNILVTTFILTCLINGIILRFFTVRNYFNIKPIIADLTVLLFISAFGYFFKPKNQFKYFLTWSIILTAICLINCVYYSNYLSFVSVSLIETSKQLGGYTDAVVENILELKDFIFLWQIFTLVFVHIQLKKKNYYKRVKDIETKKVRFLNTIVVALITLGFFISMLSGKDISRLNKQWDRRYVVMEFGVYVYQTNDVFTSIKTKVNSMFGYDEAAKAFREYYSEKEKEETKKNMYSNIFEGKNVIVIHGESLQGFTMNLAFNGKELTPNLNKLAKEGIYFSNFYSQESVGNSSDSEFTSLTSLMPSSSGTVFMNYFDREYITLPSLLKEKGYYTFSMHANVGSAWNRESAYKYLGYNHFYNYTKDYTIDEELGLGLSDKSFFRQSTDIIKGIKESKGNFYGTLVMLTNHTPFTALEGSKDYNVDIETDEINPETGEKINESYLEGTKMGNYLKSVNYADSAIGEFINELDSNGLLDNTVVVIYGDHDSKLKKSEFKKLYENENNYIDKVLIDSSKKIEVVDDYTYEINRKVPFIIWTKDLNKTKYNKEVKEVMGMIDVMPTLGNMLGVKNKYALGHDIFSINENVVVFPSGNFITDKVYYNSSLGEYRQLDLNTSISTDYLENYSKYAEKIISISNGIITYDLIKKINEEKELLNSQQ